MHTIIFYPVYSPGNRSNTYTMMIMSHSAWRSRSADVSSTVAIILRNCIGMGLNCIQGGYFLECHKNWNQSWMSILSWLVKCGSLDTRSASIWQTDHVSYSAVTIVLGVNWGKYNQFGTVLKKKSSNRTRYQHKRSATSSSAPQRRQLY